MELRQLRYFVAVAEAGNISRAAQRIFLTQPALSRQIKALEEAIGHRLFERAAHSIRLTPAGEVLLREARELLGHADQVWETVRAAGRGTRLRVGYAPSLASGLLAAAVESFSRSHPGARIELLDCSTAEMRAGLESDTLDVAVTVGQDSAGRGLQWTPLIRSAWRLAVNRRHPLARRARVTLAEVAREPLLVYGRRDYPEYWEMIRGWLKPPGARPRLAGEYDGAESLLAAVESGLGVALVSARTAHLFPRRVQLKLVTDGPPPLCIAAGCRAARLGEKPLAGFVEELRRAAKHFA